MARPKEQSPGVSLAFQGKCNHEQEKLQQRLARQLRYDMTTLLEEGTHADLTLIISDDTMKVHSTLLKSRFPLMYTRLLKAPQAGSLKVNVRDVEGFKRVIKEIYTADNLNEASQMVVQWIAQESTSPNKENVPTQLFLDANGNHKEPESTNGPLHDDLIKSKGHPSTSQGHDPGRSDTDEGQLVRPADTFISDGEEDRTCAATLRKQESKECCPLGTDLLRMFHNGLDVDVTLEAQGKQFKAHRSILCARSTYFAAMLGGGWVESSTDAISLEGMSAGALEQALLYMYGGVVELSVSCDLAELVRVADMYGIQGLRDIAVFVIKRDYCHFFHKPCSGCLVGVCDTLPLTLTFGLVDLLDRCLKWSTKHFVRLWPSKSFACLAPEVLERCCKAATTEISSESIIDIILDTDRLMGIIPQVKWAEPVVAMTTQLMDTCVNHLSNNLVEVVETDKFRSLGTTMALGLDFLEGVFGRAIMAMPVNCACRTYLSCRRLEQLTDSEFCDWSEDFKKVVHSMYKHCEQYLHQYINLVVGTDDWGLLTEEVQTIIKEGAWYVSATEGKFQKLPHTKPHAKGGSTSKRPMQLPSEKRSHGRLGSSSKTPTSNSPSPVNSGASSGASSGGRTPLTPTSRSGRSPQVPQTLPTPSTSTKSGKTVAKSAVSSATAKVPPKTSNTLQVPKKKKVSPRQPRLAQGGTSSSSKMPTSGQARQQTAAVQRATQAEARAKNGRFAKPGESLTATRMNKESKKAANLATAKVMGQTLQKDSTPKPSKPKGGKTTADKHLQGQGPVQTKGKQVRGATQPASRGVNKVQKRLNPTVNVLERPPSRTQTNSSESSQVSSPRSTGSVSRLPRFSGNLQVSKRVTTFNGKNNDAVFAKCRSMHIASMKERRLFDTDLDEESVISSLSHVAVRGSTTSSVFDLSPSDLGSEVQSDTFSDKKSSRSTSPTQLSDNLPGLDEGYVSNRVRSGQVSHSQVHLPTPKAFTYKVHQLFSVTFSVPKRVPEM